MITERLFRSSGRWAFAALASLLILALQAGGITAREMFQFDRLAFQAGELWRLLTAHWVHLDWQHSAMNLAGLWLLALVDIENRSARRDLAASTLRCVMLSVGVGLLLYLRHPQLGWYLGLSGVLHGLFVIVLVRAFLLHRDRIALVVLLALIGKLVWEHYHGALTQDALSAPVIVAAHSYGAMTGLLYALIAIAVRRQGADETNQHPGE